MDQVFKRIRTIKSKIAQQYPEAFKASGAQIGSVKEEDDEYDIEINERKRQGESASPPVLNEQIQVKGNPIGERDPQ